MLSLIIAIYRYLSLLEQTQVFVGAVVVLQVRHGTVLATVLAGKFNDDTPLVLAITRYYWLLLAITVVAGNSG